MTVTSPDDAVAAKSADFHQDTENNFGPSPERMRATNDPRASKPQRQDGQQ